MDGFNLISVYDSAGNEEFALRITDNSVQLKATIVEGASGRRRPVTVNFQVSLNDGKWHRMAFSFEVSIVL